jgi:hypothetical protein
MDGNVCSLAIWVASCSSSALPVPDFLLSFGDAQGNFLAVKVSDAQLARLRHRNLTLVLEKRHMAIPTFCRVCC